MKEILVSLARSVKLRNKESPEATLAMSPAADIVMLPFTVSIEAQEVFDLIEASKRWAKEEVRWIILGPLVQADGPKIFNHIYVINDGGGLEALCKRPSETISFFSYKRFLMGCITCEELLSLESAGLAARLGLDILFAIGKRPSIDSEAFEALVRVRALKSAIFVLASDGDFFWAFSPSGKTICEGDVSTATLARVDPLMVRRTRKFTHVRTCEQLC